LGESNHTANHKLLSGALHGVPNVVIEAIDEGADVNYKQSTALKYAVMNNDLELVMFLVRIGADIPSDLDLRGSSKNLKLFFDRVKKLKAI
jgi:ankyrin repeat protein